MNTNSAPRDWLRLSTRAYTHPKVVALPSDAARWAWIASLSVAKVQTPEGTFASEPHATECLGRHARHLAALLAAGLLERHEDGRITVHDWPEWQTDRDARYREAHRDELAQRERERRRVRRGDTTPSPRGHHAATTGIATVYGDLDGDGDGDGGHPQTPSPIDEGSGRVSGPAPRPLMPITNAQEVSMATWQDEHAAAGDPGWLTRIRASGGDTYGQAKREHLAWERDGRKPVRPTPRPRPARDPDEVAAAQEREREDRRRGRAVTLARGIPIPPREGDDELRAWGLELLAAETDGTPDNGPQPNSFRA